MEPSRLPTPSNLLEITASIIKNDMTTYETMHPIRNYSEAYLSGKKDFTESTRASRKRGATSECEGSPSRSQHRSGPSHMITGIQITATIKPMQPSTSAPQSHILSDWTNIVKSDAEAMVNLRKPAGHSDAYLYYVSPDVRRMIFAQKIDTPLKSLKDSITKIVGPEGQRIADEIDNNEEIKECLRWTLAKRIKTQTSTNPDCSESLKENVHAVFK